MNWGNSLLVFEEFAEGLSDLAYSVGKIFHYLLLAIWALMANVVNAIESVFRNLAGLGTGENSDMVSEIINHPSVGAIFGNMVGLATAVIIFFTILKIIQEHYKEKDGGNPYKIVLRTFKGLLMFFFVQAAVIVGLEASQVMFRALDAASGGGNASVAGQVFKAMAYDANRKRVGRDGRGGLKATAMNAYYARMDDSTVDTKDGKYYLLEMTGDPVSGATASQQYFDLFPSYRYGIVNADGSVTPLANWMQTHQLATAAEDDEEKTFWEDFFVGDVTDNTEDDDYDITDGTLNGSVGYKNELLRGFNVNIRPTISLNWSPVDIWNYKYEMQQDGDAIPHGIDINLFGFSEHIDMTTSFVRYFLTGEDKKSLEDSAKQFGISLNGQVSLQAGEASASFSLDMFKPSHFTQIFSSVLMNLVYTHVTQQIIEAIPRVPGSTSIGSVVVNYMQIIGPLVMKGIEKMNTVVMDKLIPKDENGDPVVQSFVVNPTETSGNIWVSVNAQSGNLPLEIEMYEIDLNFRDLWGQLQNNFNELLEQMRQGAEAGWAVGNELNDELTSMANKIQSQSKWISYKEVVNKYNDNAVSLLTRLSEHLSLYDKIRSGRDATVPYFNIVKREEGGEEGQKLDCTEVNNWLAEQGFPGTVDDLITSIKSNFLNLVQSYNKISPVYGDKNLQKPMDSYADALCTPALYKPIIEFKMHENVAYNLTVTGIIDAIMNQTENTGKVTVNMAVEEVAGKYDGYRLVDWSSYGPLYNNEFKEYIDLYHENKYVPIDPAATTDYFFENNDNKPKNDSNGKESIWFADLSKWGFFLQPVNDYPNNPFKQALNPMVGNKKMTFGEGHWGERGITIGNGDLIGSDGNVKSNRYYQHYKSTAINILDSMNMWDPTNTWLEPQGSAQPTGAAVEETAVSDEPVVYDSTARGNAAMTKATTNMNQDLAVLSTGVDTSSPLANEFSKNIITFRELGGSATDQQKEDKKVLNDWIEQAPTVRTLSPHRTKELYNMTPEEVDDLMMTGANARRYLMITRDGTVSATEENAGDYIALFSCLNLNCIDELYDLFSINFVIGYIGLVSALGVYLNFVFGLIQRAVNMAVLYMLSPISIAFYPFDDGQKFNSNFVSQFYKEAISAFSIIISLNLFIVLLGPVQKAVETVTGSVALGWLGLVAFTSMLTKIRDNISSLLGANSIQSKGINTMFSDARKATHAARESLPLGKGVGKAVKGYVGLKKFFNKTAAGSQERAKTQLEKIKAFEEAGGKLGFRNRLKKRRLERKANPQPSKRAQRKERLENALGYDTALSDQQLKDMGMGKSEQKRYRALVDSAERRAKNMINADANFKNLSEEQKAQKIAEKKQELLQSEKFRDSVNGVVSTKKQSDRKLRHSLNLGKGSFINDAVKMVFAQDGNGLIQNSKSKFWGGVQSIIGAHNAIAIDAEQKKFAQNAVEYQKKKRDLDSTTLGGVQVAANKYNEAAQTEEKGAAVLAGEAAVNGKNLSIEDRYQALYLATRAQSYMERDNLTQSEAMERAKKDFAAADKPADYYAEYNNLEFDGKKGDAALGAGLASGSSAFASVLETFGVKYEPEKASLLEALINQKATKSEKEIKVEISGIETAQATAVTDIATKVAAGMGINKDNKKQFEKLEEIIAKSSSKDALMAAFAREFSDNEKAKKEPNALVKLLDGDNLFKNFAAGAAARNEELRQWQVAEDSRKLRNKGEDMLRSKLGTNVPKEAVDRLVDVMRNQQDANVNSTNEKSLGAALKRTIEEHKNNGGKEDDEECLQKISAVKKQFTDALTREFRNITDNYGAQIRAFNTSKKFYEDMNAASTVALLTEKQNQREFHINMNMDVPAIQAVVNDSLIQRLHDNGDYVSAGIKLQQLIDSIRSHDVEKINSLGFDQETVDKLMSWQERGSKQDLKNLEGIRGLGVFDAANFGSPYDNMGGDSISGMEATFARITTIGERKIVNEMHERAIRSYQEQEAEARSRIKSAIESMKTTFDSPAFGETLTFGFQDQNGNQITDTKQFAELFSQMTADYERGVVKANSDFFKKNYEALQAARAEAIKNDNQSMVNAFNIFFDATKDVVVASERSDLVDIGRNEIAMNNAKMNEDFKKLTGGSLKPPTGGGH